MSYIETLSEVQKQNIGHIISAMTIKGVTNDFTVAAILSVVSKESAFLPKNETTYANTPNDRIRKIFGSKVSGLTEDELTLLKSDRTKFFDAIYGGRYGNAINEGAKYAGRGFNQLTFKNNYKKIATNIGVDIVTNPDLMNNIDVAALALVQYFCNAIKTIPNNLFVHYRVGSGINGFTKLEDAVNCMYHANAGFGKTVEQIQADKTGGLKKTKDRSQEFLELVK